MNNRFSKKIFFLATLAFLAFSIVSVRSASETKKITIPSDGVKSTVQTEIKE